MRAAIFNTLIYLVGTEFRPDFGTWARCKGIDVAGRQFKLRATARPAFAGDQARCVFASMLQICRPIRGFEEATVSASLPFATINTQPSTDFSKISRQFTTTLAIP
jgi:hypothetical protein